MSRQESFHGEERQTGRYGSASRMPVAPSAPPPPDDDTALGQVMAAVARLDAKVNSMGVDLGTLTREVSQLGKDAKEERPALAKHAAQNTSNRMAVLLGALFTLWEIASPFLHEAAKWGSR